MAAVAEDVKMEAVQAVQAVEVVEKEKVFDAEHTPDHAADKRPLSTITTMFNSEDGHISLITDGLHCSTIQRDGYHCLLSGGRATTGVKAGRYMFEARVLELQTAAAGGEYRQIRVGWGTAGSSFVPGADAESFSMDNDGGTWSQGKVTRASPKRWGVGDVVGVFLNLDPKSKNADTMSFFHNGERLVEPIPLPDEMKGKVLFPMIGLRCAAAALNFGVKGGRPTKELPFRARMIDDAAKVDVVASNVLPPKDGKYNLFSVVGLPQEGTYDYLDHEFYPKHPDVRFVEVSHRALMHQCLQSGMDGSMWSIPSFNFPEMSRGSLINAYKELARTQRRHAVVMNAAQGMLKSDRMTELKAWAAPWFKKTALVTVGAPPKAFSAAVQKDLLAVEEAKLKASVAAEKMQWDMAQVRKQNMTPGLKAAADASGEKAAEEETPDWDAKLKVDKDIVKDVIFRPTEGPLANMLRSDILSEKLGRTYSQFSLPVEGPVGEAVDQRWLPAGEELPAAKGGEGFDAVEYAWQKKPAAEKYLSEYQKQRKVREKFSELVVGDFCKEQIEEWGKLRAELKMHADAYALAVKKRKEKKLKEEKELKEEPKEEEEKKEEEAKPDADGDVAMKAEDVDGVDYTVDDDAAPVPVPKVKDISDIDGKKTPLYKDFGSEDWLLMQMRVELSVLVHAFKADATSKDADRRGITLALLPHYYQQYFGKTLIPFSWGMASVDKMIEYASDVVMVQNEVLVAVTKEPLPATTFVKKTEEERRERERRIAAGDEASRLQFSQPKPKGPPMVTMKGKGMDMGKGMKGVGKGMYQGGVAVKRPYGAPPAVDLFGAAKRPRPTPAWGAKGFTPKGKGK